MNPFDFSGMNHGLLYNIKTGYWMPEAVVDFHLNVKKKDNNYEMNFIWMYDKTE